ncbi:MAG: tRNA glutamyl-Q(34) synthetase GluQRS [Gammaproteobacteria bacterium]
MTEPQLLATSPPAPQSAAERTHTADRSYQGRFAPSPTGPLHFGSLVTALGSYLDARAHHGRWRVRIEDLDPPREPPGAADAILRCLESCALLWDGAVVYQHTRRAAYRDALALIVARGRAYPCACSRREIADSGLAGLEGPVYPGTCRHGLPAGKTARVMRVRVPVDSTIGFADILQGDLQQQLAREVGDFVLQRAEGYFAYQLAVVVDDAFEQITHVVRGADLLLSTPRQIYLQQLLGLPTPVYMHLPVVVNPAGEKLSKQTGAVPVDAAQASAVLFRALEFLRQSPPPELHGESPGALLHWAVQHWQPEHLRRCLQAPEP